MSDLENAENTSGTAQSAEPIDTDFEPVIKVEKPPKQKKGLGWFVALFLALFSGGIGAIGSQYLLANDIVLPGIEKTHSPTGSNGASFDFDSVRPSIEAYIEAKLTAAKLNGPPQQIDVDGVDMNAIIAPISAKIADLESEIKRIEAEIEPSVAPQINTAIDGVRADLNDIKSQLDDKISGLNSDILALTSTHQSNQVRIDLLENILQPLAGNDGPSSENASTPDNGSGDDKLTDTADAPDTPSTPDADNNNPEQSAELLAAETVEQATSNDAPQPLKVDDTDTENDPQAYAGLTKILDIQNRARATLLLAKMAEAIDRPENYKTTREDIAEIDLNVPELTNFLAVSETIPPTDASLSQSLLYAKQALEVDTQDEADSAVPALLEGFIKVKRSNPRRQRKLAVLDNLITLSKIGEHGEAKILLDSLELTEIVHLSDYLIALEARLTYEAALTNAQAAMSRESE